MASDNVIVKATDSGVQVRTKPCWICGQHSYVTMPVESWENYDWRDMSIDTAWPDGTPDSKQLLRTGVHPKCWDEEFPDNGPKENS